MSETVISTHENESADLEALRDEWHASTGAAREQLAARIDEAEGKLRELSSNADASINTYRRRADVHLAVLRDQVETAGKRGKQQLQARLRATRDACDKHLARLEEDGSGNEPPAPEVA